MARTSGNNLPILYLNVSKEGRLYETLKTTLTDEEIKADRNLGKFVNDSTGHTSYRRYYDSTDFGKVEFIGVKEIQYNSGKQKKLFISINNGQSIDCITLNLLTTNKNLSGYVKNLACLLPNVDFSKNLSITPSKKVNERGYADSNFYLNYEDKSLVQFAHKFGKDGDIPSHVKEEKMGEVTNNYDLQDDYLYKILESQIERFKEFKSNGATQETQSNTQPQTQSAPDTEVKTQETIKEPENTDDLPF